MTSSVDSIPYILLSASLIILMYLTAYGSCYGMSLVGTSSSLYSHKKHVLPFSYMATIFAASIFFETFILVVLILTKIDSNYKLEKAIFHSAAALILGFTGYGVGILMGNISKVAFRQLFKKQKFGAYLFMFYIFAEILFLIAFMCSIVLIR